MALKVQFSLGIQHRADLSLLRNMQNNNPWSRTCAIVGIVRALTGLGTDLPECNDFRIDDEIICHVCDVSVKSGCGHRQKMKNFVIFKGYFVEV